MKPYAFNWCIEAYGHGKWLRSWLGWPQWLPLPAYSDHGVSLDSYHAIHEIQNEFRIHFFWSVYKQLYASQKSITDKRNYIQIPHPYLHLKLERYRHPNSNRSGLLVFWPHTTSKYTYDDSYVSKYLEYLAELRNEFHDICICIAFHDLHAPWAGQVMAEHRVVSAGDYMSPDFPERLFSLIDQYEFATSPWGGSQAYYCTMLGVKYFIDGPKPQYVNLGDPNIPESDGLNRSMRFNAMTERNLAVFAKSNLNKWLDKVELTESLLGASANPSRFGIKLQLAVEMVRLLTMTRHGYRLPGYYVLSTYCALMRYFRARFSMQAEHAIICSGEECLLERHYHRAHDASNSPERSQHNKSSPAKCI
jgi:hypothetical protein